MDDYSFGWTSAAGIIAEFCAMGGKITKRVFPPLNTTDYSSYVRQLPPPGQVDGYFWVVGGTGTGPALKAYEQAYGTIKPKQALGEPVPLVPRGLPGRGTAPRRRVRRRVRHGAGPRRAKAVNSYHAFAKKTYPRVTTADFDDGFLYNYYQATKGLVTGLNAVRRRHRREAAEGAAEDALGTVQQLERAGTSSWTRTGRRSRTSAGADRTGRQRPGGQD